MRIAKALLLITLAACAPQTHNAAPVQLTDSSRLAVRGGEIWYRVVGHGSGFPLVLLHGGPGTPSIYLRLFEALGDERPVVRYDQLGAGNATHVTDTTLFTIPRYVEELETLRRHLGIERMHLYGHSWGATLALEYYRAHPQHVESMIFASPVLEAQAFFANMRSLFRAMPDSLFNAVQLHERGAPYDSLAYRAAMLRLNTTYGTRKPNRDEMQMIAAGMNQSIANYMTGTSVFNPNGTMRDYDATPFLKQVKIPVLYTVGEFDLVGPEVVRRHASITPASHLVIFPGAGHVTQWDAPSASVDSVRSFLRQVERMRH
jgi:proline iminopeptidase